MGRELVFCWVGRPSKGSWEDLCSRYRKRIGRAVPVREIGVRAKTAGGGDAGEGRARLRAEAEAIQAALPDPSWQVALDRRGEAVSSGELAQRLGQIRTDWPHPVTFILGSDLGLDRSLVEAARWRLSLGPMTLSHELARLVLYEQIYRAISIESGSKYHRRPL